ncbi:POLAc domain-containing protein [Azospirillaceae bacterium]
MKALTLTHRTGPRFVTNYGLAGTKPFRLGSRQLFDHGGNAQNPSKSSLRMYIADPGTKFVQVDQAGADALCVAYLAKPGLSRELFKYNVKPHVYVALLLFTDKFRLAHRGRNAYSDYNICDLVALDEWPALRKEIADSTPWYFIAKKIVHSSNYRMGARTFQMTVLKESGGEVVLTFAEAKAFLDFYKALFTTIVEWQQEIEDEARQNGILYNMMGFPRVCGELMTDSYVRDLISWRPASTVACITHQCINTIEEMCHQQGLDWHLQSNKHDSCMYMVPDADVELASKEISNAMKAKLVGRDDVQFQMGCGVQVGTEWSFAGHN